MPLTYMQTVEILSPKTTLVHYSQELAPVMPEWVRESNEHEAIQEDGYVVIWWKDGPCDVYLENGIVKRFWPKPTLADAVLSPPNCGSYYRFHSDGTVEQVYKGMNYYWGPTEVDVPESKGVACYVSVNRCDGYAYFDVLGQKVTFEFLPESYLATVPCDCADCYFEVRQAAYRARMSTSCSCAVCRDSDEEYF